MIKKGIKVKVLTASKHSGQTGTVEADYGNYILVKADDEDYENAHKNSCGEGKYFQVDNRAIKIIKA